MSRDSIENLEELIRQHVGDNKQIVDTKIAELTAPGDNYGGVLLKVDITLENEEKSREELNAVVKLIPTNEFMRKLFNIQVTCKKEIAFYDIIVPLLQEFQREHGVKQVIDFVPKLYGARINLNGSEVVDDNSAIVLENLVQSGYKNVDRRIGFDLETTKLILKDMAALHAVPLAFKISKPEVFQKKIKPYLTRLAPPPPPPPSKNGEPPRTPDMVLLEFLEDFEECRSLIPVLKKVLKSRGEEQPEDLKGPFLTIVHADIWVNNIMIKFEDSKPVANKFVDFQSFTYGSPANDLFFFFFSSVQKSVIEQNLDDLVRFYHNCFIEHLQQLHCDITPFTHDVLIQEIKLACKLRLDQALFMTTFVILSKKGGMVIEHGSSKPPDFGTKDDITPEAKDRVLYMIKEIKIRGWLE